MASRIEDWRGPEVLQNVTKAAAFGIDQTLALCVADAKGNHSFTNRTGLLEGSIQSRAAKQQGVKVVGVWGSFSVIYAIFIEAGTAKMSPMPFLRPAADKNYPSLPDRINAALGAMS